MEISLNVGEEELLPKLVELEGGKRDGDEDEKVLAGLYSRN